MAAPGLCGKLSLSTGAGLILECIAEKGIREANAAMERLNVAVLPGGESVRRTVLQSYRFEVARSEFLIGKFGLTVQTSCKSLQINPYLFCGLTCGAI